MGNPHKIGDRVRLAPRAAKGRMAAGPQNSRPYRVPWNERIGTVCKVSRWSYVIWDGLKTLEQIEPRFLVVVT